MDSKIFFDQLEVCDLNYYFMNIIKNNYMHRKKKTCFCGVTNDLRQAIILLQTCIDKHFFNIEVT